MASISTLGVGSGLDLSSILDSLEAAEKSTLTPISKQQSSYTAKLSAYGTLKSALESFQTANTALNKADLFTAPQPPAVHRLSAPPPRAARLLGNTPLALANWRRHRR